MQRTRKIQPIIKEINQLCQNNLALIQKLELANKCTIKFFKNQLIMINFFKKTENVLLVREALPSGGISSKDIYKYGFSWGLQILAWVNEWNICIK